MALKQKVSQEQTRQRLQQNSQHAAEVLAAQIPRLELYQGMSVSAFIHFSLADSPGGTLLHKDSLINKVEQTGGHVKQ